MWCHIYVTIFSITKRDAKSWQVISQHFLTWNKNLFFFNFWLRAQLAYIKALQALHDTPPLCLFLLLHMFWHKNINVTTRFDQIHQLFHKIPSINIILKSIKGHSVEKFGKIMCVSHNMDHIYQCINKILSKSIISKNWNFNINQGPQLCWKVQENFMC